MRKQDVLVCFKSCPRVGGIRTVSRIVVSVRVSSRAPVWGASDNRKGAQLRKYSFKSCPRVGGISGAP